MFRIIFFTFFLGSLMAPFLGKSQTIGEYPIKFSASESASKIQFQESYYKKKTITKEGVYYEIEKRYFKENGLNELIFSLRNLASENSIKRIKFTFLINDTLKNLDWKI